MAHQCTKTMRMHAAQGCTHTCRPMAAHHALAAQTAHTASSPLLTTYRSNITYPLNVSDHELPDPTTPAVRTVCLAFHHKSRGWFGRELVFCILGCRVSSTATSCLLYVSCCALPPLSSDRSHCPCTAAPLLGGSVTRWLVGWFAGWSWLMPATAHAVLTKRLRSGER